MSPLIATDALEWRLDLGRRSVFGWDGEIFGGVQVVIEGLYPTQRLYIRRHL